MQKTSQEYGVNEYRVRGMLNKKRNKKIERDCMDLPGPSMKESESAASSTARRKAARSQPWRDDEAFDRNEGRREEENKGRGVGREEGNKVVRL